MACGQAPGVGCGALGVGGLSRGCLLTTRTAFPSSVCSDVHIWTCPRCGCPRQQFPQFPGYQEQQAGLLQSVTLADTGAPTVRDTHGPLGRSSGGGPFVDGWTEVYGISAARVATACAELADHAARPGWGSGQRALKSPSESLSPGPEGHALAYVQLKSDSLRSLSTTPKPPSQTRAPMRFHAAHQTQSSEMCPELNEGFGKDFILAVAALHHKTRALI